MKAKMIYLLLAVFLMAPYLYGNDQNSASKNLILVLDNSGSMKNNDPGFLIKNVVNNFVNELDTSIFLGIYLFADQARQIVSLTQLNTQENRQSCINSLDLIDYRGAYTNIPAVMEKAVYELKQTKDAALSQSIIFITDGFIDTGDKNKDSENRKWLFESLAVDAGRNNIKIFGIAFTEDADYQLIQAITTRTNGEYFRVYEANEIENTLVKIIEGMEPVVVDDIAVSEIQEPEPDAGKIELNLILTIGGTLLLIAIFVLILANRKKSGAPKMEGVTNNSHFIPKGRLMDLDQITSEDEFILSEEVTTIGRHTENTICLDQADNTVSGLSHAQIVFQDNAFHIKDLSTNYTKVNDKKLEKKKLYELKNEDIISIMKYRFKFILPDYLGQTEIFEGSTVIEASYNSKKPDEAQDRKNPENGASNSEIAPENSDEGETKDKVSKLVHESSVVEGPSEDKEEKETMVKPDACPNHLDKTPVDVCEECLKPFCEECLITSSDKTICIDCAKKTTSE